MRNDEEYCKSTFDEFLKRHYRDNDIAWQDGNEPPDYYLTLCGIKYAVEVTSLFEDVILGDKTLSERGFTKAVLGFLKQIEQKASQEQILSGAYVARYKPLKDFAKNKKSIAKSIIAYLRDTQSVPSADETEVIGHGHLAWHIKKYPSKKQYLTGTTSDAKWRQEAVDELIILLNRVLHDKVHKLAVIPYPKILLIANKYPWVGSNEWHICLPNLNQLKEFHTIFLISRDLGNSVLHSVESSWLNQP